MSENVLFAFILTLVAGLATGIGSAIGFFARKTNTRFLSVALGFSAGVMIYIAMVEIYAKSGEMIAARVPGRAAGWLNAAAFFAGIALIMLIDQFVPEWENPHETHRVEEMAGRRSTDRRGLMRVGLMTALALTLHNFPEGLATFMVALHDAQLGLAVAVAVAVHNIPEGIAVSIPVYYATGSRKKAFFYSFASGLSEPLGALFAYFFLVGIAGDLWLGLIFSAVGGIMVFISLDQLLPAAREFGEHHLAIFGLVGGMAVMAASLLLLQ